MPEAKDVRYVVEQRISYHLNYQKRHFCGKFLHIKRYLEIEEVSYLPIETVCVEDILVSCSYKLFGVRLS